MSDLSQFSSLTTNTQIGESRTGELLSTKLIGELLQTLSSQHLEGHVLSGKSALEAVSDRVAVQHFDHLRASYLTSKKSDKKTNPGDIFSKLNPHTLNQVKNHALRFERSPNTSNNNNNANNGASASLPSHNSMGSISSAGSGTGTASTSSATTSTGRWGAALRGLAMNSTAADSREYEDVLSKDILEAPLCDICVVQQSEAIPDGFYRILKTPSNKKANLNSGSGGNPIYLCIKKDLTGQIAPITNLIVIFPDRGEYVPPSYHVVHRGKQACNLNTGTSAERIYLCFKRDFLGNPIVDLQPVLTTKGEDPPQGFYLVEKSVSGIAANLNLGSGGVDIFLAYRQELTRLSCLLNQPQSLDGAITPLGSSLANNKARRRESLQRRANSSEENLTSLHMSEREPERERERSRSPMMRNSVRHFRHKSSDARAGSPLPELASLPLSLEAIDLSHAENNNSNNNHNGVSLSSPSLTRDEDNETLGGDEDDDGDFYDECEAHGAELVQLRKTQEVVDATGESVPAKARKALYAILSSVYVRQGITGELAVAGLTKLLKDTDFYENDLKAAPIACTITMFDLTIEAVCDRFDLATELEHERIMIFLRTAIKHSGARMSPQSLQRMFRTINHICLCYSTKSNWIASGYPMPCNDPAREITPFKVLKHLVWDMVAQAEKPGVDVAHFLPETGGYLDCHDFDPETVSESYLDVREVVEDLIEETMDAVDAARICEMTFSVLVKQNAGQNHFWQNMNLLSKKLFFDHSLRSAFVVLCAIVTQALQPIRMASNGEPIPRDIGAKLVALEAINEYCLSAGEKLRMSKIMGYTIRRIVVPALLHNVTHAMNDHRVFAKVLKVITALWKKWRRHIRIEFAILCEHLVFKVLQANVLQIRPIFQMIAINEVTNWFDQPYMLIEMFVNYDMDRKFVSHWNTFSYLVRAMCAISRQLTNLTGAWNWRPGAGKDRSELKDATDASGNALEDSVTIRDVHLEALEEVSRMAKTLMDASGHAYLMMKDLNFRNRSIRGTAGWEKDDEPSSPAPSEKKGAISGPTDKAQEALNAPDSPERDDEDDKKEEEEHPSPTLPSLDVSSSSSSVPPKRVMSKRLGSIKLRRAAHQEAEDIISKAIQIYTEKSSLKKAVQFLISKDFMPDTPQEIANFLRVYKNSFDPVAIGDFLGEGGVTVDEEEYWSQIRFRYTRAISFAEMEIEQALRLYLTGCGFRLPGEAQKINRFVEVFVKAFWQDNSGTAYCAFRHPDTIHLLSYAIIMLNTDLHRANIDTKRKGKKMTKDEFIANLRGADQGQDIAKDTLARIYDSIAAQPIELATPDKSSSATHEEASLFDKLRFNATHRNIFASNGINSNNNNNDNAALPSGFTPLSNAPRDDGMSITTGTASPTGMKSAQDKIIAEKNFKLSIAQSLRDAEDLMRSLSSFNYRFQMTNVDVKMSLDLVSFMFETVWFHFHTIVESLVTHGETHNIDVNVRFLVLDILCYSLTSAIFLDLKVERMAFATLLRRFRAKIESLPHVVNTIANNSQAPNRSVPDDSWYALLEANNGDNSMETISKLHHLIMHLKDTIQESMNYEITRQVAAKFEKKARILEQNTFFVRQGDLQKLHSTGGSQTYRFFLFSDHLIYAHLSAKKEYVVHEALSLNALTVSELENDPHGCSFWVQHPKKSFVVVTESPLVKQQWLRDINQSIVHCKKRQLSATPDGPTSRRMSIIGRIEDQQQAQLLEQTNAVSFDPASPKRSQSPTTPRGRATSFAASILPFSSFAASRRRSYRHHTQLVGDSLVDNSAAPVEQATVTIESEQGSERDKEVFYQAVPFAESTEEEVKVKDIVPSAEARAAKLQDALQAFENALSTLSEKSLNSLFLAGTTFWRSTSSTRTSLTVSNQYDPLHLKLCALQKQARFGSYEGVIADRWDKEQSPLAGGHAPISGAEIPAQIDAWKELGNMPSDEAKKEFLQRLFASAPYWKYEQFL